MCKPFEPQLEALFRYIVLKTLFLVTLASGAHREEILALVRTGLTFSKDGSHVIIYPDPQFVPKSKRGVSFSCLMYHVGKESQDRFLCPVRCGRYLHKSRYHRLFKDSQKLFLPLDETSYSELSTHGHKLLLLAAIEEGYKAMDLDLLQEFKLCMHDMQKLSLSVVSASGVSLDAILSAGSWKHQSTFTKFYLRSMASAASNLFSLMIYS